MSDLRSSSTYSSFAEGTSPSAQTVTAETIRIAPPILASYLNMMRDHAEEGHRLSHRNAVDLLAEVDRLTSSLAAASARIGELEGNEIAHEGFANSLSKTVREQAARLAKFEASLREIERVGAWTGTDGVTYNSQEGRLASAALSQTEEGR